MNIQQYQLAILNWYDQHGRKDLPWQKDISPYRVWISEIMLQQTQVKTVIPYFNQFMQSFPTLVALANADQEAVLRHWSGLGYYARARNLHKSAQIMRDEFQGEFPSEFEQIIQLPGIGRSTAGAILSIAMQKPHPIMDGNVKRVLCRFFAIQGWPGQSSINQHLWQLAHELTPNERVNHYTQAMMDLGATLCTRSKPQCEKCPLQISCAAKQQGIAQQLPTAKPKKQIPTKQRYYLLLENAQGEWQLQQRPNYGIWGGLWSLPEYETVAALEHAVAQQSISDTPSHWLPTRQHSFSHYHLILHTKHVKVTDPHKVLSQLHEHSHDATWFSPSAAIACGLPAPIKQLLQEISDDAYGSM